MKKKLMKEDIPVLILTAILLIMCAFYTKSELISLPAPKVISAGPASVCKVHLTWEKRSNADFYEIYRGHCKY